MIRLSDHLHVEMPDCKTPEETRARWQSLCPELSLEQIDQSFQRAPGAYNHSKITITVFKDGFVHATLRTDPKNEKERIDWTIDNEACSITSADSGLHDSSKHIAKQYMREIVHMAKAMQCKTMFVGAGGAIGGYAWATYGFIPKSHKEWEDLKKQIETHIGTEHGQPIVRYKYTPIPLREEEDIALKAIMKSDQPEDIEHILQLHRQITTNNGRPITVGKAVLMGKFWNGRLSLDPLPERFVTYASRLPLREESAGRQ